MPCPIDVSLWCRSLPSRWAGVKVFTQNLTFCRQLSKSILREPVWKWSCNSTASQCCRKSWLKFHHRITSCDMFTRRCHCCTGLWGPHPLACLALHLRFCRYWQLQCLSFLAKLLDHLPSLRLHLGWSAASVDPTLYLRCHDCIGMGNSVSLIPRDHYHSVDIGIVFKSHTKWST